MASGTVSYALSISHFVNKVGSDAGFAAIIGLAILILLYFAQARETATLREGAAEAAERIRQLESRVNQLLRAAQQSQSQPPPAPVQQLRQSPPPARFAGAPVPVPPPPPGAPAPIAVRPATVGAGAVRSAAAAPAAVAPLVIAPMGTGAPNLTAATKLIPTDVPAPPAPPAQFAAPGATAVADPIAPASVGAPIGPPLFDDEDDFTDPGTNGHGGLLPRSPAPAGTPPRVQIRAGQTNGPGGPRRPTPSRPLDLADDEPHVSPARRIIYGVLALIVVAVIVIVLVNATGGSGSPKVVTNNTPTTNAPAPNHHKKKGNAVNPADVTVSVLNGTASQGLAGRISTQLGGLGYKPGKVTNAAEQTVTATIVGYLPGFRKDGVAVARALNLSNTAVSPVDSSTEQTACGASATGCTSNVVVTVGADLASSSSASSGGSTIASGGSVSTNPTGTNALGSSTNAQ